MKKLVCLMLTVVSCFAQAAGFYELDLDHNSPSKQVVTVTVGGAIANFAPMLVVDSTGYYEGFIGYPMKLGPVSVTPHLGLEGLGGVNPKTRGLLVTSTQIGQMNAMMVNEFGGVTGNFHKERLWFDVGQYSLGLVNHRFAGFGPRVDRRLSTDTTVYLQYLRKESSSRLTVAVVGTF